MPWRRVSLFPGTTNSTLAPRLLSWPSARFWAPFPTPTRVITEALPITMPSMVSRLRSRLARRVLNAIPTVSRRGSFEAMGLDSALHHGGSAEQIADRAHLDQIRRATHTGEGSSGQHHQVALGKQALLLSLAQGQGEGLAGGFLL